MFLRCAGILAVSPIRQDKGNHDDVPPAQVGGEIYALRGSKARTQPGADRPATGAPPQHDLPRAPTQQFALGRALSTQQGD